MRKQNKASGTDKVTRLSRTVSHPSIHHLFLRAVLIFRAQEVAVPNAIIDYPLQLSKLVQLQLLDNS